MTVIDWVEPEDGILAYRYPMQDREIQNGGKLTVRDSQTALTSVAALYWRRLPLLRALCRFWGLHDDIHPTVVGGALLLGTITDELLRRWSVRLRSMNRSQGCTSESLSAYPQSRQKSRSLSPAGWAN